MGVVAPPTTTSRGPAGPTRARLDEIAHGRHGEQLKTRLRNRYRGLDELPPDAVDDALQEAYARAYSCCEAEPAAVYAWLEQAAIHRLKDRLRALMREHPRPSDSNVFTAMYDDDLDPARSAEDHEQQRELEQLFAELADQLPPRHRAVLALHSRGRKRPAVAGELGISDRAVKRSLERTLARARELLVERCDGGCPQGGPDVWRLAFGLATGSQAARAQLHLLGCPTCQAFHERLGWWREAAAAAVPVPAAH